MAAYSSYRTRERLSNEQVVLISNNPDCQYLELDSEFSCLEIGESRSHSSVLVRPEE